MISLSNNSGGTIGDITMLSLFNSAAKILNAILFFDIFPLGFHPRLSLSSATLYPALWNSLALTLHQPGPWAVAGNILLTYYLTKMSTPLDYSFRHRMMLSRGCLLFLTLTLWKDCGSSFGNELKF